MKYCLSARSVALLSLLLPGAVLAQSPQSKFYPITPCRAVDTRNPNGASGGPALAAGGARAFQLAGSCGVPVTARAVVTNLTVVNPSSAGDLAIFPTGTPSPTGATAINFKAGRTRANNFIARLGTTGDIAVFTEMPSGTVHFLIDVSGYFEDPPPSPLSTYTAVANLTSFGATPQLVAHIRDVGVNGWLNEQFSIPPNYFVPAALFPDTIPGACTGTCQRDNYTMYPLQSTFLYNALYYPDQLRMRVFWALHKFLVVSGQQEIQPSHMIPYLNILYGNAFGHYRDILYQLTVNPAMGDYLNMRTSTLQNPNENYAREILQLFSIGLVQLNTDGTPKLDLGGNTIPTYNQNDINELSRVFTGWRLAAPPVAGTSNYTSDMVLVEASHDRGKKSFLCDWSTGTPTACAWTFNANQNGDVDVAQAIDAIMAHPNVAPYVSTQLIHGLVTSNPSPAYVGRVAAVFNNNGSGVKGDLAAVVRAIVTDSEALAGAADPNFGILRDPVYHVIALLRGLGATAANGSGRSDGVLAPQLANLGQNLFNPDTVFGYYPADNRLPGSSTMWGPEFGIQSALTALRRANLVNTLVYSTIPTGANNPSGTALDLSVIQSLSNDPAAMVEQLNQLLCRGQLSAGAKSAIVTAVNAVPSTSPKQRAQQAVYLVATSSQFQVER
ncbi:MAG TPA: DUF1800 domain-containing protein [Thermoanaerobaculia bacterium]|nr:DUF1800 domain-containing protein [Thermoanaerobaculia bacterium]